MNKNIVFEYPIKIADISKSGQEFIINNKIYNLSKEVKHQDERFYDIDDITLSTYYYSALKLLIQEGDYKSYNLLDSFINLINKVIILKSEFYYYENDNDDILIEKIKEIVKFIEKTSLEIKYIYSQNKLYFDLNEVLSLSQMIKHKNIYYSNWVIQNKKLVNKMKKGFGCVSIAYPIQDANCENSYFSLSGSKKDYCGSYISSWSYKMIKEYNAVGDLIEYFRGYKFIECHLMDNTLRYTYMGKNDGRVLLSPHNLILDYHMYGDKIIPCYSCCERKILANMGFVNTYYLNLQKGLPVTNLLTKYIFKIQKEVCRMCRPAMIGCKNIYFPYTDYKSLITIYGTPPHTIDYSSVNPLEPLINV